MERREYTGVSLLKITLLSMKFLLTFRMYLFLIVVGICLVYPQSLLRRADIPFPHYTVYVRLSHQQILQNQTETEAANMCYRHASVPTLFVALQINFTRKCRLIDTSSDLRTYFIYLTGLFSLHKGDKGMPKCHSTARA